MHRFRHGRLALLALGLGVTLAGCGSTGSFDPTDWLDFMSNKKPIPGERHLVFPEGVPGVPEGVPKELVKGYQPPPDTAAIETAGGAKATASVERKVEGKKVVKKRVASRPRPRKPKVVKLPTENGPAPTQITVGPGKSKPATAASQPAPKTPAQSAADAAIWGSAPGRPATTATGANAPWPSTAPSTSPAPWPAAPPPNQVSH